MATMDPGDDRQHGHAIRRRQGGRTSIYHEQLYPVAALQRRAMAGGWNHEFEVGAYPGTCAACGEDWDHSIHNDPVGSDNATGAY